MTKVMAVGGGDNGNDNYGGEWSGIHGSRNKNHDDELIKIF